MKIRTQLIVALLLLAVLPLTGVVLFSYASSRRAVHQTVWAEAEELTADMEHRLAAVKNDFALRLNRLGSLNFAEVAGSGAAERTDRAICTAQLGPTSQDNSILSSKNGRSKLLQT